MAIPIRIISFKDQPIKDNSNNVKFINPRDNKIYLVTRQIRRLNLNV